jgi:hypothetical protein
VRACRDSSRVAGFFFQRLKEYGGGFWVGRTYTNASISGVERPVSLIEGMQFMIAVNSVESRYMEFLTAEEDPNLTLFQPKKKLKFKETTLYNGLSIPSIIFEI